MSSNKKLKHERTKAKAKSRKVKRKKKKELRAKRPIADLQINNLSAQIQEQNKPTFNKSAFQALKPPDNTNNDAASARVLNKKPKAGFDKGAWGPPDE